MRDNHQEANPPDLLESLGGEPLDGSGFETEIPEPDFEWRDSR